ncbi:hypothetical protein BSBH6_03217 [Bacillus subtilis]|nr:hypothetical protein BSBH6_03217 [Bacillus subtilis]RPK23155.1 hypothetical protein BH5_03223 [Bacillus subtilis]
MTELATMIKAVCMASYGFSKTYVILTWHADSLDALVQ